MKYEVRLQPLAEDDLEQAYLWAAERAPDRARGWLDRFQTALKSLELNPQRCGFAPESRKLKRELRQYLFGKKPHVYRAVFVIDGNVVRIIRIRHAARRWLTRTELE